MPTTASLSSLSEITTGRLVLRKARAHDRAGLLELQVDPAVRTYLGGPRPSEAVERLLDETGVAGWTAEPGSFVVADRQSDRLIGTVALLPRAQSRPGHVLDAGGELELSYALRRDSWGHGLAEEAARALLAAAAAELPDQPVLIVTQMANERSLRLAARLGFQQVGTFEEFDATQALCLAGLHRI